MYKLVACDLDGTIISGDGRCDPSVAATVRRIRQQGSAFAICTGRPVDSIVDLLAGWGLTGLTDYLIGNNGGEVWEMATGKRASFYQMAPAEVREIIDRYEPLGLIPTVYEGAMFYAQTITPSVRLIAERVHSEVRPGDIRTLIRTPQYKEMFVLDPEQMTAVEDFERTHPDPRWRGMKTSPYLFEVSDARLGKDTGLAAAAQMMGIQAADVIAFGDTTNDIPMLVYAGCGVAMANGSPDTRAVADDQAPGVDEQGFARYMDRRLQEESHHQ